MVPNLRNLEARRLLPNFLSCKAVFHQTLAGLTLNQSFLQKRTVKCIKFDEKMTNNLNSLSYGNVRSLLAFLLSVPQFSRISAIKGMHFQKKR